MHCHRTPTQKNQHPLESIVPCLVMCKNTCPPFIFTSTTSTSTHKQKTFLTTTTFSASSFPFIDNELFPYCTSKSSSSVICWEEHGRLLNGLSHIIFCAKSRLMKAPSSTWSFVKHGFLRLVPTPRSISKLEK